MIIYCNLVCVINVSKVSNECRGMLWNVFGDIFQIEIFFCIILLIINCYFVFLW